MNFRSFLAYRIPFMFECISSVFLFGILLYLHSDTYFLFHQDLIVKLKSIIENICLSVCWRRYPCFFTLLTNNYSDNEIYPQRIKTFYSICFEHLSSELPDLLWIGTESKLKSCLSVSLTIRLEEDPLSVF